MSTVVLDRAASPLIKEAPAAHTSRSAALSHAGALLLLTPCVLLIHGFHPFADDAGIYVAGIRKVLDPSLFPVDSSFVVAHTQWSIFSHIFAEGLRITHLPLETGLLIAYILSIYTYLLGCLSLSRRIFDDSYRQWTATLLGAILFTLPVAATALSIMDPYVTARSFSTPLSLLALSACLGREWKRVALWLLAVALMHPLMAAYLAAFLTICILTASKHWKMTISACLLAFAGSGMIYVMARHTVLPYGYQEAVQSRYYFFLANWRWYEWIGLIAPAALMLVAVIRGAGLAARTLCLACVFTGATAILISICFIHANGNFLLARLQPLRSFQMIYAVGVILLGGYVGKHLRGRLILCNAALLILTAAGMLYVQKQVYATSAHVEWPGSAPRNLWQQAFLWIRNNTPANAVFAVDPDVHDLDAADAQGFRAMTSRSELTDELKDGGVVAIFPQLAPQWKTLEDRQRGLESMTDAERISKLRPTGADWLLLGADASTQLHCPYRNAAVKVCRML